MLYVLARTLAGGRREGVLSSLGTFLGGLVHVAAAATGLSLVLAASAAAFAAVKYAGAAYLIYLGLRMVLERKPGHRHSSTGYAVTPQPILAGHRNRGSESEDGAIFSGLHSSIRESSGSESVFRQFLLLGAISVAMNTSCDLAVTFLAAPIGARLKASPVLRRRQRAVTGLTLMGLGAYVAVSASD